VRGGGNRRKDWGRRPREQHTRGGGADIRDRGGGGPHDGGGCGQGGGTKKSRPRRRLAQRNRPINNGRQIHRRGVRTPGGGFAGPRVRGTRRHTPGDSCARANAMATTYPPRPALCVDAVTQGQANWRAAALAGPRCPRVGPPPAARFGSSPRWGRALASALPRPRGGRGILAQGDARGSPPRRARAKVEARHLSLPRGGVGGGWARRRESVTDRHGTSTNKQQMADKRHKRRRVRAHGSASPLSSWLQTHRLGVTSADSKTSGITVARQGVGAVGRWPRRTNRVGSSIENRCCQVAASGKLARNSSAAERSSVPSRQENVVRGVCCGQCTESPGLHNNIEARVSAKEDRTHFIVVQRKSRLRPYAETAAGLWEQPLTQPIYS